MEQEKIETQNHLNPYPVIALRGKVAFPHTLISFEVGRDITLKAIESATAKDRLVLICTQRITEKEDVGFDDLYTVGTVARIKQVSNLQGGTMRVICEGLFVAKAEAFGEEDGYYYALAKERKTLKGDEIVEEAYFRTAKNLVKEVLTEGGKLHKETLTKLEGLDNAEAYIYTVLSAMRIKLEVKQECLAEQDLIQRLKLFERCLNDELQITTIEKKIALSVRQSMDKAQKEYFLREQLKAIHTELGDDGKEEDEYTQKVLEKGLPQDLEVKCLKEIDRLKRMQSSSPEYNVITSYLDQVLALPWTEETQDTENLEDCIKVLDQEHFGLEKIKERIVEYLAVLKLTGNMKAPILCFVGPPGVGKTSIAKSVANALNRKFIRMSLGGVKDEAEIRGHRRTYIGAMPGRIIYGMKNAGSINPVFLLDEIDKITADMHGDPASALLEALDPEQNATFRDRYLETPYDLSKVLFITTANNLESIPAPLLDRMEIIQLSGYTLEDKIQIARRYLVPKQLVANGLDDTKLEFLEEALRVAIEGYTREAGVRNLERIIGSLCRKIAVNYAKGNSKEKIICDGQKVIELLGAPKFTIDTNALKPQTGAVTGLAWTAVGGTTLTVEVVSYKGKGEVKLTGSLGDVMKESAVSALTYIKSNAQKLGVDIDFATTDVHVHVPEGATPKDGPSAGITMATAMLSAFTGIEVRGDIAMTGEITVRGNVLPIGGLKEKALAARRVGITSVIIPKGNEKDLKELPKELLKDVTFYPVERIEEVFALALGSQKPKTKKERAKRIPAIPKEENPRESVRC